MSDEIIIAVGNVECTAELLVDKAPRMCEIIERHLPIVGMFQHAKIVDREVFFQAPFYVDIEENLKLSEKGDISFWNARQVFCIFFDDMVPMPGLAATVAKITSNLEGFQKEVVGSWETPYPGRVITFMKKDTEFKGGIQKVTAARQRIWFQEPPDIGRLLAKVGARNQKATPRLYAATKLQTFQTFLSHMRSVAISKSGEMDLKTVKLVTLPLFEYYQQYYSGHNYDLIDTGQVVGWAKDVLNQAATWEEYVALLSELELYIGRMDYWLDLHIPWAKLGEVIEKPTA